MNEVSFVWAQNELAKPRNVFSSHLTHEIAKTKKQKRVLRKEKASFGLH